MRELRPAAALLAFLAIAFPAARAATFTVDNTADSGPGSLRKAIQDANASGGLDDIHFNILGAGVHTITFLSGGQPITDPVTIDATTQPGTTTMPLIELTTSVAGAAGFVVATATGSEDTTIRGFVINGFNVGIQVNTGVARVAGNFIGTDATGTSTPNAAAQLGDGVSALLSGGAHVGGPAPVDANVIGGWGRAGVYLDGGAGPRVYVNNLFLAPATVEGNFIGVDRALTTPLANGQGVHVNARPVAVPVTGNVIAHNLPDGAVEVVAGVGSSILDNSIYANASGIVLTSGGNNGQPAPVLLTAASDGLITRVTGTQAIPPSEQIHVQLFSNPVAERQGRSFLGEIPALGTGSFDVTFPVGSTPGHFANGTATRIANGDTSESSNDLLIAAAPLLAKAFVPGAIGAGSAASLRFTLTNLGAAAMTGVGLSDSYPAGLVNFAPPIPATTCGGAPVFAAAPGGASFTASGLTVPANGTCEVTVAVTAPVGSYLNTMPAGSVVGSTGPSLSPASATLQVGLLAAPGVTKSFDPSTVPPGGVSTLTVTLTNGSGTPITGVAFTDTYPAGMVNAALPGAATTCGAGVAMAAPGPAGNSLSLSGGTIPANGSCTVSAAVTANGIGSYPNDIPGGALISDNAQPNDGTGSTATLRVAGIAEVPALGALWLVLLAALLAGGALLALRQR